MDSVFVRTAADLEKKYKLGQLGKNFEIVDNQIVEVKADLNQFVNVTYPDDMGEIQNELDGKVETYYYNGTPSLSSYPASEWDVSEYQEHVGDLYYDQLTGYVYRFNYSNNVYEWAVIHDKNAIDALSIANDAYDTADNKRRIFTELPTPPYDNGDLWVQGESGDILVCQVAKEDGQQYSLDDWVNASKYTDNTYASAIVDEMGGTETTILSGQVVREMANYTKFTDLATGGSTTIAGENITTGSIKSQNYVQDTSGTKIDLTNGKISTPYTDIDDNGFKAKSKDGEYILINPQVGFSAYDKNDNRIYYADRDTFYMKKANVQEQISLVGMLDILPMEKYTNGQLTNRGVGFI